MCLVTSTTTTTKSESRSMPKTPSVTPLRSSRSPKTPRSSPFTPGRVRKKQQQEWDDSPRNSVRVRVWLLLLAGSFWSLFSLHQSLGNEELSSVLHKEMEQESKYLATLFEKTTHDAKALLDGHFYDTASAFKGTNWRQLGQNQTSVVSIPPGNQPAFTNQQTTQRLPSTGQVNYQLQQSHHSSIDFSKLVPERHHAIVIPYRDRKFHLEQFIEYMGPYLRRNFANDTFELWIVEQDDSHLFNRAWLANVGIASIKQQNRNYKYQVGQQQQSSMVSSYHPLSVPPPPRCIILHDVDLIPTVDGVPYTNCSRPMQLGSELAHFNNSVPYPIYTGGVGPTMLLEHWDKINGMSNDFYGWGGEDDDLWHRLRLNGLLKKPAPRPTPPPDPSGKPYRGPKFWPPEILRPPKGRGKYRPISEADTVHRNNKSHDQWKRIGYLLELMQNNSARWKDDGLRDLKMTLTGDAMTVTHLDSIGSDNSTVLTDPTVVSATRATTTTITKQHFATAKQQGSIISSLSIEPTALASFAAIHHIKAIPKLTALEFVHVTQTDGSRIERAGAAANIAWGACHFRHALEKEMKCPDVADPELEGNVRMRPGLETHDPWHSPLQDFEVNPYRGRPTFAVVRSPYERLIEYYFCPWNGYKGTDIGPASLNAFMQEALYQPSEKEKMDLQKQKKTLPPSPAFRHLRPQYHYIFASNKVSGHATPFVTHVLRYENLDEDFRKLMHLYKLDRVTLPEAPLKAAPPRLVRLTPNDFNEETLRRIHQFYAGDFGRFNYQKIRIAPKQEPAKQEPAKQESGTAASATA